MNKPKSKPANAKIKAAREYAKLGWRVFPILAVRNDGSCECGNPDCDKAGKHPAIKGWPTEATTDVARIDEWWGTHPDRGIGIATGADSGLTVLDVDGDEGAASLTRLIAGGMPVTPTVETRPGHYHYYFRYNKDVNTSAGKLGDGLDTRSDGGYVVAPPSPHALGGPYKWLKYDFHTPLADWPQFGKRKAKSKVKADRETFNAGDPKDVEKITDALAWIDCDDEEKWAQIGWVLGRAFKQSDGGFKIFSAWAARSRKYDAKKTRGHYYERSKEPYAGEIKTTASIYDWAREAGWVFDDGRVVIHLRDSEMPAAARIAMDVLGQQSDIYARGGVLTRAVPMGVVRAEGIHVDGEKTLLRDDRQLVLVPVSDHYLCHRLDELCRFERAKPIDCPLPLARRLLSRGEWPNVNDLLTISNSPFLRNDGTICHKPGYDWNSKVLLSADCPVIDVPNIPTDEEVLEARETLLAPFAEIPWAEPVHQAAYVACILTMIARSVLPYVPTFMFIAPNARTGKTLLADCAGEIVLGYPPTKQPYPTDEDEMRKTLYAIGLAGDTVVLFDNLKRGASVGGEALNLFVTSNVSGGRKLGVSETRRFVNSCTVCFTGNNITATADFAARSMAVVIDAKMEYPEKRKFKIPDLRAHVRRERPKLLQAALTMLRAFIVEGMPRPKGRAPLGGFEDWDRLIACCVIWFGMEDPVKTKDALQETDVDKEAIVALLNQLLLFADPMKGTFTVAEIKKKSEANPDLYDAICDVIRDPRGLGHWLKGQLNTTQGGITLTRLPGTVDHVRVWKVRKGGS